MNMAPNTQEKRTIKVKEFLDDFRSGMGDQDLQEKYQLSQLGLEKFYGMLMDRGILSPQELQDNYRGQESEEKDADEVVTSESSFICPQCLASHKTMFDICPSCGVSFQEMINEQRAARALEPVLQESEQDFGVATKEEKDPLDGIFAASGSHASKDPVESELHASEFCGGAKQEEPAGLNATDAFAKFRSGFDDPSEDIVAGMPYGEPAVEAFAPAQVHCDGCETVLDRTIRSVYDRAHSQKVLITAGGCFLLGLLSTMSIHYFAAYSFARLLVVYSTGVFLLFGSVLLAVGSFLFMAKEKVYCCPSCRRVYPRE